MPKTAAPRRERSSSPPPAQPELVYRCVIWQVVLGGVYPGGWRAAPWRGPQPYHATALTWANSVMTNATGPFGRWAVLDWLNATHDGHAMCGTLSSHNTMALPMAHMFVRLGSAAGGARDSADLMVPTRAPEARARCLSRSISLSLRAVARAPAVCHTAGKRARSPHRPCDRSTFIGPCCSQGSLAGALSRPATIVSWISCLVVGGCLRSSSWPVAACAASTCAALGGIMGGMIGC